MRIAVVALLVVGIVAAARANGRPEYTITIHFRPGNDQEIIVGNTFGVTTTTDGGTTWRWMCEQAVGYAGRFDPDFAPTASGAVFATTNTGQFVMRDGCTFNSAPSGMTFVSQVEVGPDGAVYYAAADLVDSLIYKSTDDGMTFPVSSGPGQPGDWWTSLAVAPSRAQRIYLTGYRLMGTSPKAFLLFSSDNGGTSYTAMSMTGIGQTSQNSNINVVGISPSNPDVVYLQVTFENLTGGDSIYKSTNGGVSWTPILQKTSGYGLAFLARTDGTCIAGTRDIGAWQSPSCDTTWNALPNPPRIGCLAQDSTGLVYACTQNFAVPQLNLTSDDYGIMKSSNLATWTGVLQYQAIQEPVQCPPTTVQAEQCVEPYNGQGSMWCCLIAQLGITSTALDCSGTRGCFGSAPDTGPIVNPPKGCCDSGSGGPPTLLALLVVGSLLLRRRRPRAR